MKISFSATNPCHIYDQALSLFDLGQLGVFFSGYPRWRLKPPVGMPVVPVSSRTLITYGFQRMPEWLRPPDDKLFRWQDRGFDQSVARRLTRETTDMIHGLPGQALETFRRAQLLGIPCVLNHASGPVAQQRELVRPEYERVGINLEKNQPLPAEWASRLGEEMQLADRHCVASSVVRDQLVNDGVDPGQIWVVPYGLDEMLFEKRQKVPDGPFRICFAGRQSLRKGITYLLKAFEQCAHANWELHLFGMPLAESRADFSNYKGRAKIIQHGALSQGDFATSLRKMHVLVLPSAEEAFGLVVVQALQCGVPCLVSDRVGAKDLIRPNQTGDIFPFGDSGALAELLSKWEQDRVQVEDHFPRRASAERLLSFCQAYPKKEGGV